MATSNVFFEDLTERILKANLLSDTSEKEIQTIKNSRDNREKPPTSTQIRKFYNDILNIKQKIEMSPEKFKKQLPYIKMLKAKVEYSYSRRHVNKEFVNFIGKYIDEINDIDDFLAFCDFFEAVIAFSPKYLKK